MISQYKVLAIFGKFMALIKIEKCHKSAILNSLLLLILALMALMALKNELKKI